MEGESTTLKQTPSQTSKICSKLLIKTTDKHYLKMCYRIFFRRLWACSYLLEQFQNELPKGILKRNSTKTFGNFQVKIWWSFFITKQLSILFVVKTWNFMKKDYIKGFTLQVKYVKICPVITIKASKYWLFYCLLWKCFLSVEINFKVIESVVRKYSIKKILSKALQNCKKIPQLELIF